MDTPENLSPLALENCLHATAEFILSADRDLILVPKEPEEEEPGDAPEPEPVEEAEPEDLPEEPEEEEPLFSATLEAERRKAAEEEAAAAEENLAEEEAERIKKRAPFPQGRSPLYKQRFVISECVCQFSDSRGRKR